MLGICVGMQVLFDAGVEHGVRTEGCGQWPGAVERLDAPVLPHMGWNTVSAPAGSTLFAGLDRGTRFYFVHSYAAPGARLPTALAPLVTWAAPRGAVRRRGRERAAGGHPVPPGEVRRRRRDRAANWLRDVVG